MQDAKSLQEADAKLQVKSRECQRDIGCAVIDYWSSCEGHLEASGMSARAGLALAQGPPPLENPPHTASFSL